MTTKKAQEWCEVNRSSPLPLFETSAKDDIHVEEAFDAVARAALRRAEQDEDLYVDRLLFLFAGWLVKTNL